jgi:hypothetical protein
MNRYNIWVLEQIRIIAALKYLVSAAGIAAAAARTPAILFQQICPLDYNFGGASFF